METILGGVVASMNRHSPSAEYAPVWELATEAFLFLLTG